MSIGLWALANWKLFAGGFVGLALGFMLFSTIIGPAKYRAGYIEGSAAIVADVTKRNVQAGNIAREAKTNVDACYDAGMNWNQSEGKCE